MKSDSCDPVNHFLDRKHSGALGARIQTVGDDIYLTDTRFIKRGIGERTTNALLIKLNQIGTITGTIEAVNLCRREGWSFVISHHRKPFIICDR